MSLIGIFGFGDCGVVTVYDQKTKLRIIQKKFNIDVKLLKFSVNRKALQFTSKKNELKFGVQVLRDVFSVKAIQLKFKKV